MKTIEQVFLIVIVFTSQVVVGQNSEVIQSDRPGQSISANTVGKNTLQFQLGYLYADYSSEMRYDNFFWQSIRSNVRQNYEDLHLTTRYGVANKTEVTLDFTIGQEREKSQFWQSNPERYSEQEMNDNQYIIGLSVRQNFIANNEAGFNFGGAFQMFRTYSYGSINYDGQMTLAANKRLGDKFQFTGNGSVQFSNFDFYFTANIGYSFTDKLGLYVEYFPLFSTESKLTNEKDLRLSKSFVNTGFSYLLSPNFAVDFSGGFLVSEYSSADQNSFSEYNIQIGITSRLDWRQNSSQID